MKEKTSSQPTPLPVKPLVSSDKQQTITLKSTSRKELLASSQKILESSLFHGTVLYLPFFLETEEEKTFLGAQKFLEILDIQPPDNFLQSLEEPFTFGVFSLKKNTPFLIFKIRSFDLGFGGILSWERGMARDLAEILSIKNIPKTSQKFQDKTFKNRDIRILNDDSNNLVLLYTFINRQYLVLTTDFDTLEEIFQRFSTSPLQ